MALLFVNRQHLSFPTEAIYFVIIYSSVKLVCDCFYKLPSQSPSFYEMREDSFLPNIVLLAWWPKMMVYDIRVQSIVSFPRILNGLKRCIFMWFVQHGVLIVDSYLKQIILMCFHVFCSQ